MNQADRSSSARFLAKCVPIRDRGLWSEVRRSSLTRFSSSQLCRESRAGLTLLRLAQWIDL